jgi:hypothetical protein
VLDGPSGFKLQLRVRQVRSLIYGLSEGRWTDSDYPETTTQLAYLPDRPVV